MNDIKHEIPMGFPVDWAETESKNTLGFSSGYVTGTHVALNYTIDKPSDIPTYEKVYDTLEDLLLKLCHTLEEWYFVTVTFSTIMDRKKQVFAYFTVADEDGSNSRKIEHDIMKYIERAVVKNCNEIYIRHIEYLSNSMETVIQFTMV